MVTATILHSLLANWLGVAGPLVLVALVRIVVPVFLRDRFGEMRVLSALRGLDPATYRHFQNIQLPHPIGRGDSRIEHVVVSNLGIFVIATTKRRGWIFGAEHEPEWVQLFYRQRSRFKNPLLRNQLMVDALKRLLDVPGQAFQPAVVFIHDCETGSPLPGIVRHDALISWIRRHTDTMLDPYLVRRAVSRLEELQNPLNPEAADKLQLHTLHVRQAV